MVLKGFKEKLQFCCKHFKTNIHFDYKKANFSLLMEVHLAMRLQIMSSNLFRRDLTTLAHDLCSFAIFFANRAKVKAIL